MTIRKWGVSLKKIVPSELEFYLENMAAEGYMLKNVGETGIFYFEFEEGLAQKAKYVVDISALPKVTYVGTLIDKGWEYLGKTGNCYIWRMVYEDKRPADFTDKICRRRHCFRLGIFFTLLAFLSLFLMGSLAWGILVEHRNGINVHSWAYAVELVTQIPIVTYSIWAARKLLGER